MNRRNREQGTQLLALLLGVTQRFIRPYAIPMVQGLLPKALDPNPSVAANILTCLGELACVSGIDIMPFVPDIMSVIVVRLGDASSVKRMAALRALGQLCSSSTYVVDPLLDYPDLLPLLDKILKVEPSKEAKREVFKVLGILGAVERLICC